MRLSVSATRRGQQPADRMRARAARAADRDLPARQAGRAASCTSTQSSASPRGSSAASALRTDSLRSRAPGAAALRTLPAGSDSAWPVRDRRGASATTMPPQRESATNGASAHSMHGAPGEQRVLLGLLVAEAPAATGRGHDEPVAHAVGVRRLAASDGGGTRRAIRSVCARRSARSAAARPGRRFRCPRSCRARCARAPRARPCRS